LQTGQVKGFCLFVCLFFWDSVSLWNQVGLKVVILLSTRITGVYYHAHLFFSCRTWTQGLHLEPVHQAPPPLFFLLCEGFFWDGFWELFALAGFEPRYSSFLPP
jgi:hypothetical protein